MSTFRESQAVKEQLNATTVYLDGCTGLTEVPAFPNATDVVLDGCTGLGEPLLSDPRGYELRHYAGGYVSGCRMFPTAQDALNHWGGTRYPDAKRGAAYCNAIIQHADI